MLLLKFSPVRLVHFIFLSLSLASIALSEENAATQCERLQASLTYPQDKAPKDIMAVVSLLDYDFS